VIDWNNYLLQITNIEDMEVDILIFENLIKEFIAFINVIMTQYTYETDNSANFVM